MLTGTPTPIGDGRRDPAGPEAQTRNFLARILPPAAPGFYVSIHSLYTNGNVTSLPGKSFDSYESAANHIHRWQWIARKNNRPYEQYFHCVSVLERAEPKLDKNGAPYLKSDRHKGNVAATRVLFIDIDVKPTAYASQLDAAKAIAALVNAGDIPEPTVKVDSGYGLHMYWVLNRALVPAEWEPIAEGFGKYLQSKGVHLDPLFGDWSRVLRPPGSWNMKNPADPRPVRLLGRVLNHDYDPSLFARYVQPGSAQPTPTPTPTSNVISLLPRLPAIAPQGDLSAGLEHRSQPINYPLAVERCAVLRETHATGGAGQPEPLWYQVILGTTFITDGAVARQWAHDMSKGHAGYDHAATEAKFDNAMRARQKGDLGWPLCDTYGKHSQACKTCPYQGRIKSPFNISHDNRDLPKGYSRKDGMIWIDKYKEDDNGNPIPAVAISYNVRDAYIEAGDEGPTLNMELTPRNEPSRRVRLPLVAVNAWGEKIHALLGRAGIALPKNQNKLAQEFLVAYIHDLQAAKASTLKFDAVGWTKTRDGRVGFAYAGKVWTANGIAENISCHDPTLEKIYAPHGTLPEWRCSADFLVRQGRVDLQVIMAGAFAAPLMHFTGIPGVLLSAYSPASGVQKSAAMQVGVSVWGHPIKAMNRVDDTYNSAVHKLGTLRNLPMYWDELQKPEDTEVSFARMAFTLTQGSDKGRLQSDITQRETGSWETMLVSASNFSVQDMMLRGAKNTSAGLNRVFELDIKPMPASARVGTGIAARFIALTHQHYGVAGEVYAQALARDHALLPDMVSQAVAYFETATRSVPEERFWIFTCATLLVGAVLAKAERLVDFDITAMRDYLVHTFFAQRVAKNGNLVDVRSPDYAASRLAQYIYHTKQKGIYLETNVFAATGLGGPPVEVKMDPDAKRLLRAPVAHLARDSGVLRIIRQDFHDWLDANKLPLRAIIDALTAQGNMHSVRNIWAGGTEWRGARYYAYEIDLSGTSPIGTFFNFGLNNGGAT